MPVRSQSKCHINIMEYCRVFYKTKCFRVEVPPDWNLYSSELTRLSITHPAHFQTTYEEKERRIQCVTGHQRISILIILLWQFLRWAVEMNRINALWR